MGFKKQNTVELGPRAKFVVFCSIAIGTPITATEVAAFAYCPEQWRLEHGLGLEAGNGASRVAGSLHHTRKAVAERVAGGAIAWGWLLAILAAVGLLLRLVWSL